MHSCVHTVRHGHAVTQPQSHTCSSLLSVPLLFQCTCIHLFSLAARIMQVKSYQSINCHGLMLPCLNMQPGTQSQVHKQHYSRTFIPSFLRICGASSASHICCQCRAHVKMILFLLYLRWTKLINWASL